MVGNTYNLSPHCQALRNLSGCIDYFQQRKTTEHKKTLLKEKTTIK